MNSPLEARELHILRSWQANATPWSHAVRTGAIASRKLVTDRAVVQAMVDAVAPDRVAPYPVTPGATASDTVAARRRRVLDIGCGEGWLARTLSAAGFDVVGVDAVPELINEARRSGGGEFHVCDYAALASGGSTWGRFDAAVCNFSLLGDHSVEALLAGLGSQLHEPGRLIIQTLHPVSACGESAYRDGWRDGSWAGFGGEFKDPAPWYFRTLESWLALLGRGGFDLLSLREPTANGSSVPASVIFICTLRNLHA